MLIGHLPAGYLIGRALVRKPEARVPLALFADARILAILAGSIFPDSDLLYFYLFDHQRTPHHLYWTHIPAFWAMACAGILLAWAANRESRPPVALWFFLLGILSHLLLDSIAGEIYWLIPVSYVPFCLITLHENHLPSYLNFLLRWTFGLEIALVSGAALLAWFDLRRVRIRWRSRYL